jgi:hypothetical protein
MEAFLGLDIGQFPLCLILLQGFSVRIYSEKIVYFQVEHLGIVCIKLAFLKKLSP